MADLLPVRHPNRDFFIVDVSDANPRDDLVSMEHPIFSLTTKPDMRSLEYRSTDGRRLRVGPSDKGLATIMDKDILIYCISKLVAQKNAGEQITPEVEMNAHEVMVACNWRTNDASYKRFRDALYRLRGTTLTTDLETGGVKAHKVFGLIEEGTIIQKKDGEETPFEDEGRMSIVRIKLSDWVFRSVDSLEVLAINPVYFRLRRSLERRLYEIARKHVGDKKQIWKIGIDKLQNKVGSNAPPKKFRFNLKSIIEDGNIPDYGFMIDKDMVMIQRLIPDIERVMDRSIIPLRADTIDKAQGIAAQIGKTVFELEQEWNEWARDKREQIDNPDAAFIGFCNKKKGSDGAKRVVEARQMSML
jgi:plasmid replication initiation protein